MSAKAAVDAVKHLSAQHSLRHAWYNDILPYVGKLVYAILNQKQSGTLNCFLISVNGSIADVPALTAGITTNDGVYRLALTVDKTQELFSALRNSGYVLIVYKYGSFEPWIKELDAISVASSTNSDPHDLVAISKFLPECHTYVELFGGSAPLLYARDPAPVEVCNDKGSFVVDFAKSLRQADRFNCFLIMSRIFPVSIPFNPTALRRFVQSVPRDDYNVTRCFGWYRMIREVYVAAYNNLSDEAKEIVLPSEEQQSINALKTVDPYLPHIHGRLLRVQYENNDYAKVIKTFDSTTTLFWVDVPVSVGQQDDTVELVETVNSLNSVAGMVALYVPRKGANLAMSQCISEGCLSGWKVTEFGNSTVYTRNVHTKRS